MCRIEDCERHELWGGFCKPHLKEVRIEVETADGWKDIKPKRKSRMAKIDAEEVLTTDATEVAEERTDDE